MLSGKEIEMAEEELYIEKEKELVEAIAKKLIELYGHYWNFEIDLVEGDPSKNYTLRVKIYKR